MSVGKKDTKSRTEKDSFFEERLFGGYHYKTTISDGRRTEVGRGRTSEESQEVASEEWHDEDEDEDEE
jgi:hypothetical protein